MKEKKDPMTLETFYLSLLFFSFSSTITHAFPLLIKGEAGCPMKGGKIGIQEHDMSTRLCSKRALSTCSPLPLETWDPLSLSPICNPYYKPSAGNTSSNELDIGTFRPN